jgi:hypothetical protein
VPNTLVHLAVQGAASKVSWRAVDMRWVYLGCLLPDIPWILRRAVVGFGLAVDPVDLRLYTMAQASWAGTLLLCAALAAATVAPRRIFAVLGANALLHLLLDACEVKWGNGVHLLAPFSWRMQSFELVSPNAWLMVGLTVVGGGVAVWEVLRPSGPRVALAREPKAHALAAVLMAAYFVAPLPFLPAIEATDSYSTRTLREAAARPGRPVSLDRTYFEKASDGSFVRLWTGERVRVVGPTPPASGKVSLHGTFVEPDLLRIDRLMEHPVDRDAPSYVALFLLVLVWARPLLPSRRSGSLES